MIERVPGWTPHCEWSLKEVLDRFLEELHCHKAACYLRKTASGVQLAVRDVFGRGDAPPSALEPDDPLVVDDALTSPSICLAPIPPAPALATLASGKATQFDPEMVEPLAREVT